MAKGYWIGHVDIDDPETYKQYQAANAAVFKQYGARFLARGGQSTPVEGELRSRHVILEFDSYQQALDCYNSLGYQDAKAIRAAVSSGDLVIVEGYDGPQPTDA